MEPKKAERATEHQTVLDQKTGKASAGVQARYLHQHGFTAGTDIMTADGMIPVEFLEVGDRVITRDSGMARLEIIQKISVRSDMIKIAAGAFGKGRPVRDMLMPAGQNIYLRDWRAKAVFGAPRVAVPAHRLVDGEYLQKAGHARLILFRLGFERAHILYASGMEVISHQPELAVQV
ncbi:Hint domain-containing protein [Nereida sp. MMG025]|uniref:Hint domain-containing protein n=1 Tax=Nereida sp. MMG025 TaxID=2909981 RepID=UPI001F333199|nr:Hint domain-containing protein [Nereida sp. MMG025]MCF6443379.1 Hint domain-containing protein [Nereida sp. MMG025]